jgi:hypothetical protein
LLLREEATKAGLARRGIKPSWHTLAILGLPDYHHHCRGQEQRLHTFGSLARVGLSEHV